MLCRAMCVCVLLMACGSDDEPFADAGVDARRMDTSSDTSESDAMRDAESDAGSFCDTAPECSPGEMVRTNAGCLLGEARILICGDDCTFSEGICALEPCEETGLSEVLTCGLCGEQTRECSERGNWTYGECVADGVCIPGETESRPCGMCGTVVSTCSSACTWEEAGECDAEGECAPGETTPAEAGECEAEERGVRVCSDECAFGAPMCEPLPPLDVILLLDVTGSIGNSLRDARERIVEAAGGLLDVGGVRVGLAVYADFPTSPWGSAGDAPFSGLLAPTSDADAFAAAMVELPMRFGGDLPESGIEALSVLSGGVLSAPSTPIPCEDGAAGGCWREGAARAIVLVTDATQHNGPSRDGDELANPYRGIEPAPAEWPAVARQMMVEEISLFPVVVSTSDAVVAQHQRMLRDLGQADEDGSVIERTGQVAEGLRNIIPRVLRLR